VVCLTERGRIKVTNGHNRAASLVRVGRHAALAWVSVAYIKPNGVCADLTHGSPNSAPALHRTDFVHTHYHEPPFRARHLTGRQVALFIQTEDEKEAFA
jgi:hypothetical protein